jgi:hypothetical protein
MLLPIADPPELEPLDRLVVDGFATVWVVRICGLVFFRIALFDQQTVTELVFGKWPLALAGRGIFRACEPRQAKNHYDDERTHFRR